MSDKSVRITHVMNMCVVADSTPPKDGEALVFQTRDGFCFVSKASLASDLVQKLKGHETDRLGHEYVVVVAGDWEKIKAKLAENGWTVTETNQPLTEEDVEKILAEMASAVD